MKFGVRKGVLAVIVNHELKVLVGSSPRDGGYKFPQGGLDPNEDVITGIKRELKEELGLTISNSDILEAYSEKVKYTYPDEEKYIFMAQELSIIKIKYHEKMQLIPQDEEFDHLIWVLPKDLNRYNTYFRAEAYTLALKICGLL